MKRPRPVLVRLLPKFTVDDGCWLWHAHRDRQGYGRINVGGIPMLAHRVLYELLAGPVPEGLELDHLCRTRACVRPDHLEPVTHAENLQRGVAARTHFICGHPKTPENTYCGSNGWRACRPCIRARQRAAYWRRKAAA